MKHVLSDAGEIVTNFAADNLVTNPLKEKEL
jgi:hypothetical protein